VRPRGRDAASSSLRKRARRSSISDWCSVGILPSLLHCEAKNRCGMKLWKELQPYFVFFSVVDLGYFVGFSNDAARSGVTLLSRPSTIAGRHAQPSGLVL